MTIEERQKAIENKVKGVVSSNKYGNNNLGKNPKEFNKKRKK